MILHYLKVALRNFKKNKVFTIINLSGLVIGLTCAILIMLWISDEMSYDKFHEDYLNIYRIVGNDLVASPIPLSPIIKEEIPEIKNSARLLRMFEGCNFEYSKTLYPDKSILVDETFFEIFSFPFVNGDPQSAFKKPASVIISESLANKVFGNTNVIGSKIKFHFFGIIEELTITGVFKDIPENSHIQTNTFLSFKDIFGRVLGDQMQHWSDWGCHTFVQLQQNCSLKEVISKINNCLIKHSRNESDYKVQKLQALKDIHLHSSFNFDYAKVGSLKHVYIFLLISIIIVVIACINYINLTSSIAIGRMKEIGIKKTIGARRKTITKQFIFESFFLVFIAAIIAIVLSKLLIPVLNHLTGKMLIYNIFNGLFITGILGFFVIAGLISGILPAYFLSSFKAIEIIRTGIINKKGKLTGKSILPSIQLALTIVIIIGALTINKQVSYMENLDPGYNTSHLVYFKIMNNSLENLEVIKSELLKNPDIKAVTYGHINTNVKHTTDDFEFEGRNTKNNVFANVFRVDYDFLKTYEAEMKTGRFFSEKYQSDKTSAFVINESAAKAFKLDNPLGKYMSLWGNKGQIIGIIKDYLYEGAQNLISPTVLWMNTDVNFTLGFQTITLRIYGNNVEESLNYALNKIQPLNFDLTPEYHFLDESFDNLYKSEKRLSQLLNISSILTILISCMGLLGLVVYTTNRRIKEIGVRKVNGARMSEIFLLLNRDLIISTAIAFIIASPIAWYSMNNWLKNFAYKTNLSWWIFALAGLLALGIALLTVSWQSWRAATRNPVESLRYE